MVLSEGVKERLMEIMNWPRINVTTLHPSDIERLENEFRSICEDGLNYEIVDLAKWLKGYFLGRPSDTIEDILDIARQIKIEYAFSDS